MRSLQLAPAILWRTCNRSSPRFRRSIRYRFNLIEQWFKIPENQYLNVTLTRKDFDTLYSAIDKNIKAQSLFQAAMTAYTNGNLDAANRGMRDSTIKLT